MVMSLIFIVVAIVLMVASGLPGLLAPRRAVWGQQLAVAMTVLGAVVGLAGAGLALVRPSHATWLLPFPLMGGQPLLGLDALSAFFLVPVLLMGALGSIYGLGYWSQTRHLRTGQKLRCFWGIMIGGMGLLLIGRTAFVFLLGWEMMALSAFFLVSTEDHLASCREAGWIYFIATHVGTLGLFALFAVWRWGTGSFDLVPAAAGSLSVGVQHSLFLLALLVFGLKAGMMPLHFWLPTAHTNAPSHVSAILSGVVLKIGIYGLLRMLSLLPNPPLVWGALVLLLAACSALLGVVFALGQHDLKRLLAYHSVENIGIILMGLGLALLGRALDRPTWMVLGMAGCLLHVWNHSFFKSLLFLCAGSVVHSAGTREIERLGGLAHRMPGTALLFQIGAVAICGLPPLNGFVSEFLIYLGLLGTVVGSSGGGAVVALVAPVLAMVGALAVACFVKVTGAVFLGTPRTPEAARATEVPWSMRGPAWVLAGLCLVIGLLPLAVAPLLNSAMAAGVPELQAGATRVGELVPLGSVSLMAAALLVTIVLIRVFVNPRERVEGQVGTWDCGYARPTPRMQYTSSSFAQMIVTMFAWVLRPHTHWPKIEGLFARRTMMRSHVDDPILDRVLVPTGRTTEGGLRWFHRFQQGLTQQYVLYILLTVIVMLAALIPFAELWERLLTF